MKRFFCFTILALTCLAAHGQRFVKGNIGGVQALRDLNPNDVHTNAFVALIATNSYAGIFTYSPTDATADDNYAFIKPTSFAGRWIRWQPYLSASGVPFTANRLIWGSATTTMASAGNLWTDASNLAVNQTSQNGSAALSVNGGLTFTGAQTVTTTTGALTLATGAANGNIALSPNGSGSVTIAYLTQKSVLFAGASGAVSEENGTFQYLTTASGGPGLSIGDTLGTDRTLYVYRSGAKTVDSIGALISQASTSSTANKNRYGLMVYSQGTWNGSGAVNYGVFIDAISGGTTNWALYNNTAANVYLGTGNVGIGTTGPTSKLHVVSSSNTVGAFETTGTDRVDISLAKNSGTAQTWALSVAGTTDGYGVADKYFHVTDVTTGNVRMTIDTSGKVGIGTIAPSTLLHVGLAGTTLGTIGIAGNTSGLVTLSVQAAAGTWTMKLPTAVGTAGFQLTDAAGDGVTSWAAAASSRDQKNIISRFDDTKDALQKVSNVPIYRFKYKPGKGTGDQTTEYVGIMADEAPWAMHFNNKILNPISTFGYTTLAIQELNKEVEALKAEIRELKTKGQ